VDVVVIGDAEEHPGVGVTLAAQLGLPVLAGVVAAAADAGRVEVTRRVDGVDERVSAPVPVVLVIAAQAAETKAPGMKELLAARKRPVSTVGAAELGIDLADAVTTEARRRPELTGAELFTGDPTDAARQLLAALRSEGVL
jgi:electron transfer flavoprotein beta subunit